MTVDTKQYIQLHLSILKEAMKKEGLIFAVATDDRKRHNPQICIIDKEQYYKGKHDGMVVSLQDLNRDLGDEYGINTFKSVQRHRRSRPGSRMGGIQDGWPVRICRLPYKGIGKALAGCRKVARHT